jgi:hypothetical protein
MNSTKFTLALSLLFSAALAQAATVTGTVTDKTTGKPAAGDSVVLVAPMSGMNEVAHTTTDARGRYSLDLPGSSPYLIRVTHQGAGYFIAAPQGGGTGDIPVYDVAAKVQGIFIEADVIEVESDNGQLKVTSATSCTTPVPRPLTQWSKKSFEVVLPEDAVLNDVGGQRPGGLPTSIKIDPDGPKGHYSINFPIQPDHGDKNTLFQISYNLPYSSGKYSFKSVVSLPADNLAVLLPKSMTFAAGAGASFKSVQEDPGIQTFCSKTRFPASPSSSQSPAQAPCPAKRRATRPARRRPGQDASMPSSQPGGGIGAPSTHPTRSRNTNGGFSALWPCCFPPPRPSCSASPPQRVQSPRRLKQPHQPLRSQMRALLLTSPPQALQAKTPPSSTRSKKNSSP